MSPRLTGRVLPALGAAFIVAIFLAPSAVAQKPDFVFAVNDVPGEPVTPVQELVPITLAYTYTLKQGPVQNLGGNIGSAKVTFTHTCPSDKMLVTGSLSTIISLVATDQDGIYEGEIIVRLQVLREAPGLTPISCTFEGSVGEVVANGIPATDAHTDSFPITPDYLPYIEALSSSKLRQGGPQKQIPFAIDLTNFGNAATKVSFAVTEKPKGAWQGLIPDPALLDPPGGNQQSKQIIFNVATPYKNGWNNDEGAFTISMTPEYQYKTDDSQVGSPITVTLLARVRGVYVPSLEPFIMVAAILGTALLVRLRREE